ncbi:MAG: tail fiber domain-containing protein [Lentimicrobiaceae bacterium]|nr:tail fiber domain-containing protein [Lentimicrobiaceae bacterium]
MKKITLFGLVILLSLLSISLMGQVPQKINYQAVARDAAGNPIANKQIAVKFTIRTGSSSGSEVFSERHTPWTNSLGTFNAIIGYGNPIYGSFGAINWGTGTKWLQIGVDEHGGTNYVDMGTFEMLSVPYARLAQDVVNINDADADPTNELQTLSISGTQLTISQGNTVTLPDGGDNWGTQVVETDATLAGNGTTANKLKIAQQGALNGQVLKWNGSTWAPADDNTGSSGGTPGGSSSAVQYNSGGSFGGNEYFTYSGSGDLYVEYPSVHASININGGGDPNYNVPARLDLNKRWSIYDVGADKHLKIGPDPGNSSNNNATPIVIKYNTGSVDIGEITSISMIHTASKLRVEAAELRAITAANNSAMYPTALLKNASTNGVALELESSSSSKPALRINKANNSGGGFIDAYKSNDNLALRLGTYGNSDNNGGYIEGYGTDRYFHLRTDIVNANRGLYIYAGESSSVGESLFFGYYPTGNKAYLDPVTNDKVQLGEAGYRFIALYATNGTINTSDERDKSAIQDLNYGLQSVLKLRPISYQWKNEDIRMGTGTNLGFSAQELQKVIPDAVVAEKGKTPEDADHTYYGVKYAEIIPVLVKAIQELEQMLEKTTNEQQELKQIVNDQQKLIDKLSNK